MILETHSLCSPPLEDAIANLPMLGVIKIAEDGFSYLDIDNNFIHRPYSLIYQPGMLKPDYFDDKTHFIGAHVSLTYPEENYDVSNLQKEAGKQIAFEIEGIFSAVMLDKKYYALKVKAPDLLAIRLSLGLSSQLMLKGFWVDFHITVAVEP